MNRRISSLLAVSVVALLLACVALGSFLPLYTDEVLWKMLFTRYFLESGKLLNLLPVCKSSFLISTPYSWIPWRALESWLYRDLNSPVMIRFWGVFSFLCWAPIFAWGCWLLIRSKIGSDFKSQTIALAVAPLTWCLFPLLLIINRPEQSIVGATSLLLVLTLLSARGESKIPHWCAILGMFILSSFIFASHPKAIFLLPVLLSSGWLLIRHRLVRASFVLFLALLALNSVQYGRVRTSCTDSPTVQKKVAGGRTLGVNAKTGPAALAIDAIHNLQAYPEYLDGAEFQTFTGNAWLRFPEVITNQFTLSDFINFIVELCLYGVAVFVVCYRLIDSKSRLLKPWVWSAESKIGVALGASLFAVAAIQGAKPFYEGAWIIPLTWLTIWILASRISSNAVWSRARKVVPVLLIVSIVSQAFLLIKFIPIARGDWSIPGSPSGETDLYRMSVMGFKNEQEKIFAAALQCGLSTARVSNSLVIDDFTYLAFHRFTIKPINVFFLNKGFMEKSDDALAILRDYDSDGLITRCDGLPKELIPIVRKVGDYCCADPVWRGKPKHD